MPDAMELRISRALDGTETYLDRITGAVVTREVPRDHIPIHGYTVTPAPKARGSNTTSGRRRRTPA